MLKRSNIIFIAAALMGLSSLSAAEKTSKVDKKIGVVNFTQCVLESAYGKDEREAFENLRKQMASLIEDCEKQLHEIASQFNDPDFLDGLSPEKTEELKAKYQTLSEEYNRYQNQFMQTMNQANMQMIGKMQQHVNNASEKVARNQFSLVVNRDAAFYFDGALDVTDLVIKEMNREYEQSGKKITAQANKEIK